MQSNPPSTASTATITFDLTGMQFPVLQVKGFEFLHTVFTQGSWPALQESEQAKLYREQAEEAREQAWKQAMAAHHARLAQKASNFSRVEKKGPCYEGKDIVKSYIKALRKAMKYDKWWADDEYVAGILRSAKGLYDLMTPEQQEQAMIAKLSLE